MSLVAACDLWQVRLGPGACTIGDCSVVQPQSVLSHFMQALKAGQV